MARKVMSAAGLWVAIACTSWASPSLTVYNGNFAVVRENMRLDLKSGVTDVRFDEVTGYLEPSSVVLRDPAGKRNIRILEQSYRGDSATQALLLELHEGKELEFILPGKPGDPPRIEKAKLLRAGHGSGVQSGPLIEMNGRLRFGLPGMPLFPKLKDDEILKPAIEWKIASERAGGFDAEFAYVTKNLTWSSDYNLIVPESGDLADMIGWVTISNTSGKAFEDAKVKLMAGDVAKAQELRGRINRFGGALRVASPRLPASVKEKSFDEYHLYTLPRRITLRDRETKQVEFVRASGIKTRNRYIYDGVRYSQDYRHYGAQNLRGLREYGTLSNPKVWVLGEFKNTKKNRLGIPLPAGKVRFFRKDDDGQLELVGESVIDHTPKEELLRIYTGNAFDLVGERKRTYFYTNASESVTQEKFEIKVRNRKKEAVEVTIVEHLNRWHNWEVSQNSHDFKKVDAHTAEFTAKIPAGEEAVVTYAVHYTW